MAKKKNPAAVALGKARWKGKTKEERSEAARKAGLARAAQRAADPEKMKADMSAMGKIGGKAKAAKGKSDGNA